MSTRSRSRDNSWIVFLGVVLIIVGIFSFSKFLNVDFSTAAEVLYKTLLYVILFGVSLYLLRDTIGMKNTALFLFPFSVFCITPALNFKAMSGIPEFMGTTYATIPWWGTTLGQFGICLFLGLISFAIWYFTRDDY